MEQKFDPRNKSYLKTFVSVVLIACIPFLVLWMIFFVLKRSPNDYHLMGSDEMDYWIESATIMRRGLFNQNTGYFGYGWQTHAKLLNFGGHGLFSIIPFVVFGSFTSWQQSSMMLVNAIIISISIIFSFFINRSVVKTLTVTVMLFMFTSFSVYFISGMLEPLMFAGSIMLGALLSTMFFEKKDKKDFRGWYLGIAIAWTLFRLSNIVFLLPIILIELFRLKHSFLRVLLKYGLVSLIVVLATFIFTAPYPWGFITKFMISEEKLVLFSSHLLQNLRLFFDFSQGWKIEIILRLGFLFWIICLVFILIYQRYEPKDRESNFFLSAQLIILISVVIVHLCFYDVGDLRDLRVLSPILFFSFVATLMASNQLAQKRYLLGSAIIFLVFSTMINFASIRSLKTEFVDPFFDDKRTIDLFKYIRYDNNARDRWQNTAYLDVFNYIWMDFNYYDPGIGLMLPVGGDFSALKPEEVALNLKAKYLITYRFTSLPHYELIASDDDVYLLQRVQDESNSHYQQSLFKELDNGHLSVDDRLETYQVRKLTSIKSQAYNLRGRLDSREGVWHTPNPTNFHLVN